jgi:pyridoxine 5-phosphate synthase
MIKLSVNVNKVATVRNSRGGSAPSVLEAARVCVDAGAPGITVHPRADARHITATDVRELAALIASMNGERSRAADAARTEAGGAGEIEYNIEGDTRPDFLALVHEVKPTQCTLVPVRPGEITSQAGWPPDTPPDAMRRIVGELRDAGIRVSLFVDPEEAAVRWAADVGGDRVELYTEPFARAFEAGEAPAAASFATYRNAAELAHSLGMGVNAGHDLDVGNLALFRTLPHLDEVSIGHALISRAIFVGLARSVHDFLDALHG